LDFFELAKVEAGFALAKVEAGFALAKVEVCFALAETEAYSLAFFGAAENFDKQAFMRLL
jgi:hypothetical protein